MKKRTAVGKTRSAIAPTVADFRDPSEASDWHLSVFTESSGSKPMNLHMADRCPEIERVRDPARTHQTYWDLRIGNSAITNKRDRSKSKLKQKQIARDLLFPWCNLDAI